ncbi:yojK [Symbiodinium natans]|uniref:YojK protein n=1 Tax=Symbiodinium natans TaxID=878477 RepID=A0A812IAG5_9DINO|nr:yojK [Symbiodinium natans]
MLEQLTSQKQMLEAKQREVNQLMSTQDQSQDAWQAEAAELAGLQANLTKEEGLYADLQKKVQKEIARLTDQQLAADKRLRELQAAYEKKQEKVDQLREQAVARGSIARNASQQADVVQANLAEAEGLVNKHRRLAETSEKVFLQAKMDVDHAERLCLDSEHEVAEKKELKLRVLAARSSLQSFYNNVDNLSRSLEGKIMDPEADAPKLFRADPLAAVALRSYNEMTASFRRLFVKSKDTYEVVAGSIPEIEGNAEAALKLLCDPFEAIEEEAQRAGNSTIFEEKCGPFLWSDLGVERRPFPSFAEMEPGRQESEDMQEEEPESPTNMWKDEEETEETQTGDLPSSPVGLPPLPLERLPTKTTHAPEPEPESMSPKTPVMGLPPPPLDRLPSKTTPSPNAVPD